MPKAEHERCVPYEGDSLTSRVVVVERSSTECWRLEDKNGGHVVTFSRTVQMCQNGKLSSRGLCQKAWWVSAEMCGLVCALACGSARYSIFLCVIGGTYEWLTPHQSWCTMCDRSQSRAP